jgi:outer membrane immunogenic protein
MKKLLLGVAALAAVALANSASAADLPVYKAPVAPVAYSWTGVYVGANAGYSWGRSSNDWSAFALSTNPAFSTCFSTGGGGNSFCANGSDTSKLNGAIGGLQAGYNWHTGSFLVGIEADIQASGQKGDQTFVTGFSTGTANPLGTLTATYTEKLTWFGTARGRVGFVADRWLVYATGGLAYGEVTNSGSATATGLSTGANCVVAGPQPSGGICPFSNWSSSSTRFGWSAGAGIEGAIGNGWSIKAEYLHVDLGSVVTSFATLPGIYGTGGLQGAFLVANAGNGTIRSRITDEIVRVGVNYKLGWAGPVSARY